MKDWQLVETPNSGPAIMDMNTQDTVMYIDDIDPEVIKSICEMYNSGMTIEWISAALANNNGCFTDQREFIMENINAYIKLTTMTEGTVIQEPKINTQDTNPQGDGNGGIQPETLTRGQKAAQTRKANAAGSSTSKKTGSSVAQDAIKGLEDKIHLIKLLDSAEVIEIPSGMDKTGRELMLEFQKEQQGLIDTYLDKVQKL